MKATSVKAGQRIRVRHEIDRREGDWFADVVGTIEDIHQQKTGSWYAHSKDDRLWLLRIRLRKDDGEISILSLDPLTEVELLEAPASPH